MCGIVGVFGGITVSAEKAFKQMLIFDQVRGEHSTGVCFVPKGTAEPIITKAVGTPNELFDTNAFTKAMGGTHRLLLGHNRFATQGKVNKYNAHPFQCDHITGVHNGSLRMYTGLDGYGQFDVDSHVLYNHISKHGLQHALQNTYGAMALVWWDQTKQTLSIFRNHERPLWFAPSADNQMGFIASEAWMFEVAAARNNIKLGATLEIPVNTLITQVLPPNVHAAALLAPTTQHITPRTEPVTTYVNYYTGNQQNANGYSGKGNGVVTGSVGLKTPQTDTTQRPYTLPKGVVITYTGEKKFIHGYEYHLFYEETLKQDAQDFVVSAGVFDTLNIKIGDSFRVDSSGFLRDKGDTYWMVRSSQMEKIGENFEYIASKILDEAADVAENCTLVDEDDPVGTPTQCVDNKGKTISLSEWNKLFGVCSCCNGDVTYTSKFKYNTSGGVYCEECVTDPQISEYLPR